MARVNIAGDSDIGSRVYVDPGLDVHVACKYLRFGESDRLRLAYMYREGEPVAELVYYGFNKHTATLAMDMNQARTNYAGPARASGAGMSRR